MPEPTDTITVDGTTYYRAGGGWRMRGARDVAVGPRFCALLDEIEQLRAERDAAPKAPAVVEAAVLTVEEAKALDTAIVHFRNDAERFDASHSVLCEGIGDALRSTAERLRGVLLRMAPAAYRAATARDARGA